MSDFLVELQNVNAAYNGNPVLENINLSIQSGEFLGIIGPNGSGKTTLLKIILGILTPTSGTVSLFNHNISDFHDWQKIGYVPQKAGSNLMKFPITVWETVSLGRLNNKRWMDFETPLDTKAITSALEAVDMLQHKKRLLSELSGGQAQRVFIAKALASRPQLLVLDEPTVGVDTESQAKFYELLKMLNVQMKLTLVLVSHDIDVVAHEVSTIACINRTIVSHGKPKDILKGDFMKKLYGEHLRMVVHGH